MFRFNEGDSVREPPADPHAVRRRLALIAAASALMAGVVATGGAARDTAHMALPTSHSAEVGNPEQRRAPEIPVLHDVSRAISSLPGIRRDLFAFRQRVSSVGHVTAATASSAALVAAPTVADVQEVLVLIGIAEDAAPDGPRRTAIISTHDQLFLVGEGDLLGPRYRVSAISSDAAELMDVVSGAPRRLEMRVTPLR